LSKLATCENLFKRRTKACSDLHKEKGIHLEMNEGNHTLGIVERKNDHDAMSTTNILQNSKEGAKARSGVIVQDGAKVPGVGITSNKAFVKS